MTVTTRHEDQVSILAMNGQINLYNLPELKTQIQQELAKGIKSLVFDMENVGYIDSSGIGVLVASATSLKNAGGRLALSGLQNVIRKTFEITKLDHFFEIYPTVTESINALKNPPAGS